MMAAKEERLTARSEIPNPQATGQSKPPLGDEFVAETLKTMHELDLVHHNINFKNDA
jgi:hypothetical protein